MSWYTIVNRIELDDDELTYIIDELIRNHPNDPRFEEVAREVEKRLHQEAHKVVLD